MDSHIVIAEPMTDDEALALLAESAVASLVDHDDWSITCDWVSCTSDGNTVVCRLPREIAARIGGHRISVECSDRGAGGVTRWLVSIRGRADQPIDRGDATPEAGAPARDLVEVRVTPASMSACRFVHVRPLVPSNAQHRWEGTS
jgi:hypothetical protein